MTPLPILPSDAPSPLDAHRRALAACRRCAATLPVGSRPVVSHAIEPRVMLVGQAPGPSEAVGGRPFIGRSGKTLFRWLAQAGIGEAEARAAIQIGAITRCYPGPHPGGRGDRVATPAERAACAPWLDRELSLIRPALVLPVGRLAIDRFLGPRPLAVLVGAVHSVTMAGVSTQVVPLPHPSGASGWLNVPTHRTLLDRAIELIGQELRRIGVVRQAHSEAA